MIDTPSENINHLWHEVCDFVEVCQGKAVGDVYPRRYAEMKDMAIEINQAATPWLKDEVVLSAAWFSEVAQRLGVKFQRPRNPKRVPHWIDDMDKDVLY